MDPDQEAHVREGFLERMSSVTSNGKRVPLSPISKVPWADVSEMALNRERPTTLHSASYDAPVTMTLSLCSQHWPCLVSRRHGRNVALHTQLHYLYTTEVDWLRISDPFALFAGVIAWRRVIDLKSTQRWSLQSVLYASRAAWLVWPGTGVMSPPIEPFPLSTQPAHVPPSRIGECDDILL